MAIAMSIGTVSAACVGAGLALSFVWVAFLIARLRASTDTLAYYKAPGPAVAIKAAGAVGVALTLAGVGLPMALGPTTEARIPSAAELAQANTDLNVIAARCNAQTTQFDEERIRKLTGLPAAKVALDAFDSKVRAAQAARLEAQNMASQVRAAAEQKADQAQRDANDGFDAARAAFDPDSERTNVVAKARADNDSRLHDIDSGQMTIDEKMAARKKSVATYEGEVAAPIRR
ncbi:MAG TPA: hypothetical protein VF921_00940 [Vicinamibacterales bacterium]